MFTPLFITGFVLLLAGLFGGRYLGERSLKLLSSDEKLKLLDSFSRFRAFGALPLLIIFLSFLGIPRLPPNLMWPAYFAAWALVAVYFVVVHQLIFRRLSELGINGEYQAAMRKARWMVYGGFAAFFVLDTVAPFVTR
ncbi:MAG TPA: hypothetical protein VG938_14945 [Verrucomicrobiae bacterium]|jgi:DMSO/TMAO reductase YedYZ heme-binding membrane subunit|nr:hypothetical protein [Verrucomicrobiae bacterium]